MSVHDFWVSVRTGARLFPPQVIVDTSRLDAGAIERTLQRATPWLTRGSVAGFNETDYHFLPDAEREKLGQLVSAFQKIASGVNPTAPATNDQVAQAHPLFRDIVGMLEFDRYEDAEAFQLGKEIEREIQTYRPRELAKLRFRTGLDHTGDPAIWIWAFLQDDAWDDERFLASARQIDELLDPAARRVAPDRWPYLSFRSLAEEAEIAAAS